MAGSKVAYLENKALDTVLGGPQFTLPSSFYIALSTAAFSASATTVPSEVSGTNYARYTGTNNSTNWPNASSGAKANGAVFTFAVAGSGGWGTVTSFYICDALTVGNLLYGADLTTSRTINSGDTASFAIGAITLTET